MKKIILSSIVGIFALTTTHAMAAEKDMDMKPDAMMKHEIKKDDMKHDMKKEEMKKTDMKTSMKVSYTPGNLLVNFIDDSFMKGPITIKNSYGKVIASDTITKMKNVIKMPHHQTGPVNIEFDGATISYSIPNLIGGGQNG